MKRLILFIFTLYFANSIQAQTIPTLPQTSEIIIDLGAPGSADPGDQIRYKVTIQNTGGANANNTQLNVVPDPRTTFASGSFRSSPLALPDAYACTGNVGISVPAVLGLLANDFDDNIAGLTCSVVTDAATTQGGNITIAATGSFTYTPPAGFTGSDTYIYTLNDGNPVTGVTATDVGAITFTVSNLIWFIDKSAAAGDGRLNTPFNSLASFNSGSATAGDVIYLEHTGTNYTGGIILQNNERLFGKGHTGAANLAGVLPFSLAPNSLTLPNINGTQPVITNSGGDGVTLASDNSLRGFDVGACSDFGIENSGTATVGNLLLSEVSINNTTGGGFDASHGSGVGMNAIFTSITSSGGTNGINLTNCAGTFTVKGGTITNPTGTGVLVSGGSVTLSCAATVTDNTGFAVDVDNHDSNNVIFSGNITTSGTGMRIQNCGGGTKTFSGSINTTAGTGITASSNNGGTINFSGSSKSLSTGTNTAVNLTNNTGVTINFTNSGLVITTTTGTGFNASGGGTVNVTGTVNTINSTSSTALNVASTTIGANGLTFQSISSGNNDAAADPAKGIVLNTTGSGGLTVTGTGIAGSGGTIQNTTDDGVSLTAANNVSLSWMNFTNIADNITNNVNCDLDTGTGCAAAIDLQGASTNITLNRIVIDGNDGIDGAGGGNPAGQIGISGDQVNGLLVTNTTIKNVGESNDESAVLLTNAQGIIRFEDVTITDPEEYGIRFYKLDNTTLNLTLRRVTIQNNINTFGEAGFSLRGDGGTSYILVDDCDFLNTDGPGVDVQAINSAVNHLTVQGNVFTENHALPMAVNFITDNTSQGFVKIHNNTVNDCSTPANCSIAFDLDANRTSSLHAIVTNNTVPSGTGIGTAMEFVVGDGATGRAEVRDNAITLNSGEIGVTFHARSEGFGGTNGRMDVTFEGNTINGIETSGLFNPGVQFLAGSSTGSHDQDVCVNMSITNGAGGNTINGINTPGITPRFEVSQRTGTSFILQGFSGNGTSTTDIGNHFNNNNNVGTLDPTFVRTGGTAIVNYTSGTCITPTIPSLPTQ